MFCGPSLMYKPHHAHTNTYYLHTHTHTHTHRQTFWKTPSSALMVAGSWPMEAPVLEIDARKHIHIHITKYLHRHTKHAD